MGSCRRRGKIWGEDGVAPTGLGNDEEACTTHRLRGGLEVVSPSLREGWVRRQTRSLVCRVNGVLDSEQFDQCVAEFGQVEGVGAV